MIKFIPNSNKICICEPKILWNRLKERKKIDEDGKNILWKYPKRKYNVE